MRERLTDPVQRSGLLIVVTTAVTSGLGFAYWLIAAHLVAPAALGLAAAALSAMTLASFASNLGGNSALLQLLPAAAPDQRSSLLGAVLSLGAGAGAIGGAVAVVLMSLDAGTTLTTSQGALLLVGVSLQTTQVCLAHTWVALGRSHVMLVTESVFAVSKLLLLGVAAGHGSTGLLCGWTAGSLLSCCVSLGLLEVLVSLRPSLSGFRKRLTDVRSVLAGNHVVNLGNTLPVYLLPALVAARLGPSQAAYFYPAWQIGSFFYVVAASAGSALQAEGARAPAHLLSSARRAATTSCLLLVPLGLLVALVGRRVLAAYGPGYVVAYGLLICMSCAALPDVVTNLHGAVLLTTRRFGAAVGLSWVSALLKLALTWVLLSDLGLAAAGVAFLLAQCVCGCWCAFDHRRQLRLTSTA